MNQDTILTVVATTTVAIVAVYLGFYFQRVINDRGIRRRHYLDAVRSISRMRRLLSAAERVNYEVWFFTENTKSVVATGKIEEKDKDVNRRFRTMVVDAGTSMGLEGDWSFMHGPDARAPSSIESLQLSSQIGAKIRAESVRLEESFFDALNGVFASGKVSWPFWNKRQMKAVESLIRAASALRQEIDETVLSTTPHPILWKLINALVGTALEDATRDIGTVKHMVLRLGGPTGSMCEWPPEVVDAFVKSRAKEALEKGGQWFGIRHDDTLDTHEVGPQSAPVTD